MDIGDIKQPVNSQYRKKLIFSLYALEQRGCGDVMEMEGRQISDAYCHDLERLQNDLSHGVPVRAWYSDAPYAICVFYHLCTLLREYENEVSAVKLPEYKLTSNTAILFQSWGEAAEEDFEEFLPYAKKLSKQEVQMYAGLWDDLREDNSPLRAVINGRVIGAPEDFYDFLIWDRLTEQPLKQAELIGDLIGEHQIGVSEWWYAKPIDDLIAQRKIRIIQNSPDKYARTICRV